MYGQSVLHAAVMSQAPLGIVRFLVEKGALQDIIYFSFFFVHGDMLITTYSTAADMKWCNNCSHFNLSHFIISRFKLSVRSLLNKERRR